jgi:hypothetical protein
VLLRLAAVDHCTGERGCVRVLNGWVNPDVVGANQRRDKPDGCAECLRDVVCLPCGGYSCGLRRLRLRLLGVAQVRTGFCCQCR